MPGSWKEIDGDGEEEIKKREKLGLLPNAWTLRTSRHCLTGPGILELGVDSFPREQAKDWSIIVLAGLFGLQLDYPGAQYVGRRV